MKKYSILFHFVLFVIVFASCDNAIQLAIPGLLTTQTPMTNPPPGVYDTDLDEIVLTSQTDGAVIYYTIDNTQPTRESISYAGPLSFSGHQEERYIRAIAFKEGKDPSPEMTASFYIEYSGPLPPSIRVEGANQRPDGTWDGDITLSIDPDLTPSEKWNINDLKICYTLDGTLPNVQTDTDESPSGPLNGSEIEGNNSYEDFITVDGSEDLTLRMVSYVMSSMGYPVSETVSRTFRVRYTRTIDSETVFSDAGGSKAAGFDLNLTAPASHEISYQLSGVKNGVSFVDPVVETSSESLALSVFQGGGWTGLANQDSLTVRSWLTRDQWQPGPAKTVTFTYNQGKPLPPVITAYSWKYDYVFPMGSTLPTKTDGSIVILLKTSGNADIYYTTDGSIPTTSSTLYDREIGIDLPGSSIFRIDAIASAGGESSAISSSWFEVK